jgi:multidrug efflux pump subunit AcrA (membrane-fusion protein)
VGLTTTKNVRFDRITGGTAQFFHALLVAFEQQESTQQQAQSIGEIGKALNRFMDKIQTLEATVTSLEEERDRLLAKQEQLSDLEQLRVENQQLLEQLEQVQAELADPRKMLERVLAQSATASIAPTTAEPVQTIASALRSNIEPSNVVPAAKTAQRSAKQFK